MKLELRNNRDFWTGLMFSGIGIFMVSVVYLHEYRIGTAFRMGPGYFPILLGILLIALGIAIMINGLRTNEKIKGSISRHGWRAIIVLPAVVVLFAFLLDRAGFVPSVMVLCLGAAAAGSEFKISEALLLTVFLTAFSVALFIWGLGLNYPLFMFEF